MGIIHPIGFAWDPRGIGLHSSNDIVGCMLMRRSHGGLISTGCLRPGRRQPQCDGAATSAPLRTWRWRWCGALPCRHFCLKKRDAPRLSGRFLVWHGNDGPSTRSRRPPCSLPRQCLIEPCAPHLHASCIIILDFKGHSTDCIAIIVLS